MDEKRGGGVKTPEGKWVSRGNGLRDGMRSRVVFPANMAEEIADLTDAYIEDYVPRNVIEAWLVSEIARTTVQYRKAGAQLDADPARVKERARGPEWEVDRNAVVTALVGRLKRDAYGVIRKTEAIKQGAEWALYMWQGLEDNVASTGHLTEAQRDRAYDLLGEPVELRPASRKLPASDAPDELRTLFRREIARLQALLPGLVARDQKLRAQAAEGVPLEPDAITRTIKSNESRAHRRLRWATETLDKLRAGVPAESLIDPETGAPIRPGPMPAPRAPARKAGASPSAATAAAPRRAQGPQPADVLPTMPQHWPRDVREALTLLGVTIISERQDRPATTPPPAPGPAPPSGSPPPAS
jgi:hypothetical protein